MSKRKTATPLKRTNSTIEEDENLPKLKRQGAMLIENDDVTEDKEPPAVVPIKEKKKSHHDTDNISCNCVTPLGRKPAVIRIVKKEGVNNKRTFACCKQGKNFGGCYFFKWIDATETEVQCSEERSKALEKCMSLYQAILDAPSNDEKLSENLKELTLVLNNMKTLYEDEK